MAVKAIPAATGARRFRVGRFLFLKKLKWILMFLVFGIMLINAVIISVEAKSVEPGIIYIGGKFMYTTQNLGEESEKIISQGGVYPTEDGFFKNLRNFLKNFYGIFAALFIMYIWIKVLSLIFLHGVLFDTSKQPVAFFLAIIAFFGLQMLFISAFAGGSLTEPFRAFGSFFKSLPYMIKPLAKIGDKFVDSGMNVSNLTG